MNESSSLERRYSFNLAQGTPIADSTHISGSSFPWGTVSPKLRCANLDRKSTSSFFNDDSISIARNMNMKKIDARIAADVQSKGLASRIVKYHDSETRLNRSMSAHNLFSKPGQFPAVTLRKTGLPYRAARRELSLIRIPPPSKSSFYGNTVSSLLRSSSVIGLQGKQSEELSTENRPIIHPPPTESDMAPTRSVLDVLKEISRKRINSDELESEEGSKKYCNRDGNDFVDTVTNQNKFPVSSSLSPCQRYKRQRECITHLQGIQHVETRTSPEQAKKRVCNYNNDITSSLSSSIKCKKLSAGINQTLPRNFRQYDDLKKTEHILSDQTGTTRNIDLRLSGIENNFKTPNCSFYLSNTSDTLGSLNHKTSDAVPQRSVSEPHFNSDGKVSNGLIHTTQKPRLTLFNKKCDENESSELSEKSYLEENNIDDFNENDCTGIPFVKPKRIVSKNGLKNPAMERTQKSKLALMLSGLRGELYQNPELDEIDSSTKKKQTIMNDNANDLTVTPESNQSLPTLTTVTSTSKVASTNNVGTPTFANTSVPLNNVETPAIAITSVSTASLPTKNTSPLVGLKLLPAEAYKDKKSCNYTSKNSEASPKPLIGGFSLSVTSSGNTPAVQSSSTDLNASENKSNQISFAPIMSFGDKINESSAHMQLPVNKNNTNFLQFASISNAQTSSIDKAKATSLNNSSKEGGTPTKLTNLPCNEARKSSSSLTCSTSLTNFVVSSTPVVISTVADSSTKPNTSIDSKAPSTSSPVSTVPFAPLTNSAIFTTGALDNSKAVTTTTSSTPTMFSSSSFKSAFISKSNSAVFSPGNANPVFSFNSNKSETEKTPGSISSTSSFNIDKNKDVSSITVFGSNRNSTTNALETGPGFTLSSDAKSIASTADQNNFKPEKVVNSVTQAHFDTTKVPASSVSIFGSVTRSSENNIFNPTVSTSVFGSNSIKPAAEVFGLNSNNKSGILSTAVTLGSDKTNTATPMPFSFGANTGTFAVTSSNNVSTAAGGFSFSSAASNCGDQQTAPSNNNFGGIPTSASQNNFVFGSPSSKVNSSNILGVTSPKNENGTQGGFSFGSATPITSFTFGAEKNSGSENASVKNPPPSFSFGAGTETKQNVLSTNKPFSFGSIQPMQQKTPTESAMGNSFNIFGSTGSTKPSQPPAFNFNSGNSQTNALPNNNIFASQNSSMTTGPGDRPIRRATRRLQK